MSAYPPQQPYQPYYPPTGGPGYGQYYGPPAPMYPMPPGGGRPGVVSAIGVTSVIVAVLSILASFGSGLYGITMFQWTKASAATARSAAARTAVPAPPPAATRPAGPMAPVTWAKGMTPSDRQTVAEVLEQFEVLNSERLTQLDEILTRSGKDVFPAMKGPSVDALALAHAVRDHGTLPSADPNDPDPVYFDTGAGRLELYNDRAVFRPSTPGGQIVRTSASVDPDPAGTPPGTPPAPGPAGATPPAPGGPAVPKPPADPNAPVDPFASEDDPFAAPGSAGGVGGAAAAPVVPPASASSLTPAQVQMVVQKVQAASGNKLNPVQLATLTSSLQAPGQQLVPPGGVWSPVSLAQVQSDGSAVLKLSGGYYLIIDSQGQITHEGSAGMPKLTIHPLSVSLVIGEAVASFALAVYLFISGMFVIRQSPRGGRLHLIFALVKIPLAILAGVGFAWLGSELVNSFAAGAGTSGAGAVFTRIGIMLAVAGVIYPITLLIALRTRAVRDYYAHAA